MNWKSMAFELGPPGIDTLLPGSNLPGCVTPLLGPTGCHLVNYHCIPEPWKDLVDLLGGRIG